MSKHWRPDETTLPLPGQEADDLQRDWTRASTYGRGAVRGPLPEGAKPGLLLLGLACVALAAGMYQAFGPLEPVAPEAAAVRPSLD